MVYVYILIRKIKYTIGKVWYMYIYIHPQKDYHDTGKNHNF